jgi:hypothetical protein
LKFNHGYFTNITTGDLNFLNGWKIKEYEGEDRTKLIDGLIIVDQNDVEVLRITREGIKFPLK